MNVHVLVPAAGSGRRVGAATKKQYLELGDQPILVHTLKRLAAVDAVTNIHLIVPAAELSYCQEEIITRHGLAKMGALIAGGVERQDSVRNGLEACGAAADDVVLIHDGVRPFFPLEQVSDLIDQASARGACLLAVPAQDTIKEVADGEVCRTLERSRLWQVQTPQAFRFDCIYEAHRRARAADYLGTDDASLVEWCGWPVTVVPGCAYNFKITTPADLALARALLAAGEVELT
jgi:2-C-methyl-D-erythritol 4-phosphate cytidylyltransferase